jgi:hypothetical protein
LGAVFCTNAYAEAIEHRGDRYVIHVDQLNLDGDESLMDVLMLCPEFVSVDGTDVLSMYAIRIDNINISIDREAFLYHTKARELGTVQICINAVAAKGTDGTNGVIDVRYRNSAADSKVALQGSTYGSARVYTDMVRHDYEKHLTLSATAIGTTKYRKQPIDFGTQTTRSAIENLRLSAKWQISKRDSIQFNLAQGVNDSKVRTYTPDLGLTSTMLRNINFTTTYVRTLNDKDADLYVEAGYSHANNDYRNNFPIHNKEKDNSTYLLIESNIPMFSHKAWLLVGTENGYENTWNLGLQRTQTMYNDFYVQFDYKHGPWLFTLGDRYRIVSYWQKPYDVPQQDLWHHARNHHGYVGSVGYTFGKNTIQGTFSHRYVMPPIYLFYQKDYKKDSYRYDTDVNRQLAYVTDLKYTYQGKDLVIMGGIRNTNFIEIASGNYSLFTIQSSAMWHKGIMRLTLGASFNHRHDRGETGVYKTNYNFYQLKCMPSLNITKNTRFTATALYISNKELDFNVPNLYLAARLSHFFNKHLNVYADYRNIAGQKTGNRALVLGAQYTL